MSANTSYAVLTRVRAQYGARLREADYLEMASCKSVPEAARFLRERTPYGSYFAKESEQPTRGWLEAQLRMALQARCLSLCRFGRSSDRALLRYVHLRGSVNALLNFLRCYAAGEPEKYIPQSSPGGTEPGFALRGLGRVRSKEELIECLRGSVFEKRLLPVFAEGDSLDLPLVEAVLDQFVYEDTVKTFREYPPQTAKALNEMLLLKAELADVELLYRAKKYYGMSPLLLRALTGGFRLRLSAGEKEDMISAPDAETVLAIFRNSKYGKTLQESRLLQVESWSDLYLHALLQKRIHFSTEPAVVLFAYLNWMELEIKNLIYVIEGVRYRLPPEEIRPLLLLPDQERTQ